MNRNLIALAFTLHLAICPAIAQDGQRPEPPPPPPPGGGGIRILPRGAEQTLKLTDEQRKQLKDLEAEVKAKVEKILTPEQVEQLKSMRPQPPGGGPNGRAERPAPPGEKGEAKRPPAEEASAASSKPLPAGVTRVPVVFSGGHETNPVDHGRPVVLVAAALGVKTEVFREAFSHVHPAGPGSGGPTETEARANKQALMSVLGKFGIENDRLDEVSNFYRYPPGSRNLWKNQPATASALVKDGAVIGYEVTSGGYGYTTAPSVTVPGVTGAVAKVEVAFGRDMMTNGSVSSIAVADAQ